MGRGLPRSAVTKPLDRKASTMSEPTACARAHPCPDPSYCDSCDLLVGLEGFHVIEMAKTSVACQRDGTTSLPRAWDHLGLSVSMLGLARFVNGDTLALPVGGALDDEGVRA